MLAESTDPSAEAPSEPTREPARLVAVIAAKGGCGATLVATHLAAATAATTRTCLVDLDSCKGDVAGYLDLHSGRSINPLLDHIHVLDSVLLQGAVDVHVSGMHVLSQPYELTELYAMAPEEVTQLLRFVRQQYEVVIADIGSRVDAGALATVTEATEIVLLCTPDVIALRDAQRILRLLHRLGLPGERVRLVLNEVAGADLPPEAIEEQLGVKVVATLPQDHAASRKASSAGRLLSDAAPHAALTRAIGALWSRLHGDPTPRPAHRWAWSGKGEDR